MDVNQMLQQTGAVDAISRELGVDPATAQAGATALLPSILSGFQNPLAAQSETSGSAFPAMDGLGGLLGSIGGLGGGGLLDNVTSNEPTEVGKGNQILGQLFGSKDGSRAVAASAAAESGVEPKRHRRRDFRTKAVAVVNCRRYDRAVPAMQGPLFFLRQRLSPA